MNEGLGCGLPTTKKPSVHNASLTWVRIHKLTIHFVCLYLFFIFYILCWGGGNYIASIALDEESN